MEKKVKSVLDKIMLMTGQNLEFKENLLKMLFPEFSVKSQSIKIEDERIGQIYEYCIADIIQKQAADFYQNFPMKDITDLLIQDYERMEFFRRKDAFLDFSLALYQQIENIVN